MRLLSLYVIKDQLYFIPNGKLPNGIYVLIEPIKQLATSAEVYMIGEALLSELSYCREISSEPVHDVFKDLLNLSKVRSHKRLVEQGRLISISEQDEHIFIELMESDINIKSFVSARNRIKVMIGAQNSSPDTIGIELIKIITS